MKHIVAAISVLALVGCAGGPPRPQNRQEWNAVHMRILPAAKSDEVLQAAQKVLSLADDDFTFEYPPGLLIARRNWFVYMVIAAASGQDYWRIQAKETSAGTMVILQISRQAGSIAPSPVVTTGGAIGFGASSTSLPGNEIYWAAPYKMFWQRLNYFIKPNQEWITCQQAKHQYPDDFRGGDTGVLCGITANDRMPEEH